MSTYDGLESCWEAGGFLLYRVVEVLKKDSTICLSLRPFLFWRVEGLSSHLSAATGCDEGIYSNKPGRELLRHVCIVLETDQPPTLKKTVQSLLAVNALPPVIEHEVRILARGC